MDGRPLNEADVQAPLHGVLLDSVVPLQQSSLSWMPARTGRLSAGVGHRHPVTIGIALLMSGSNRWL